MPVVITDEALAMSLVEGLIENDKKRLERLAARRQVHELEIVKLDREIRTVINDLSYQTKHMEALKCRELNKLYG
jgi:hypothetical protein